jgi:hypothetical protein
MRSGQPALDHVQAGRERRRSAFRALFSVKLPWPEGANSHGAIDGLQQVTVGQPAPETGLVELAPQQLLARELQFAQRECFWQKPKWATMARSTQDQAPASLILSCSPATPPTACVPSEEGVLLIDFGQRNTLFRRRV